VAIARVIGEPLFRLFVNAKEPSPPVAADDGQATEPVAATAEGMILDDASVGTAIKLLTQLMNADELLETMRIVFESVSCEGRPVGDIDATFNGKNKELWQVFVEALKVNFADFLADARLRSIVSATTKAA
jgi:hypothetical protein